MDVSRFLTALGDAGDRLARAAAAAGLGAPVPTCPGWTVRDLLGHVGGVHRWATAFVASGRTEPFASEERARLFATPPDEELASWYAEGLAALVGALSGADPALRCWTFMPAPTPLAFWSRRQAHETAIHCADAEASAQWPSVFPADLATDGIDELLTGFLPRLGARLAADPPLSLALAPTDAGTAWTVRLEPDGPHVSSGASPADCTVSGAASDCYLLLWNRRELDAALEVRGDPRVLERWRERATVGRG